MSTTKRWFCDSCRRDFADELLLRARSPFDSNEILAACPECKSVDTLMASCHVPGCGAPAGIGESWPGGEYRWSCHLHCLHDRAP